MFGLKRAVVEVKEEPVKVPPTPRKVIPTGTSEEVEQYVSLCKKINAETPVVRMLQLRQFLAERGMPEYDSVEVQQHLTKLCGNSKLYTWCPLREEDKNLGFRWSWNDSRCHSRPSIELYYKLVPPSVLETVATILEKFPDAKFFVSDISEVNDPFLGVTFPMDKLVIVDFWNEPDFRPSK